MAANGIIDVENLETQIDAITMVVDSDEEQDVVIDDLSSTASGLSLEEESSSTEIPPESGANYLPIDVDIQTQPWELLQVLPHPSPISSRVTMQGI